MLTHVVKGICNKTGTLIYFLHGSLSIFVKNLKKKDIKTLIVIVKKKKAWSVRIMVHIYISESCAALKMM